jgi:hypothetical protein
MPSHDVFHTNVKQALIKDQWRITHDPLTVQFGTTDVFIDLGAEQMLAAEKAGRTIAVEVKSFLNTSIITDFHLAVGQVLNYRVALEQQDPERILYLAVPIDAYSVFFVQPITQLILQRYALRIMVYDPEQEEVVQWID